MRSKLFALLATTVIAGAAHAQNWQGFYAGLSFGNTDESEDLFNGGVFSTSFDYEGSSAGVFAGYNVQSGPWVYGGELAFSPVTADDPAVHSIVHEDYFDLKGRLGYSVGQVLFYGVLGYSSATMIESPGNVEETIDGVNYGIGVDYMVSQQVFVGAEILGRNLDVDYTSSGFPGFTGDVTSRTFSLRVGMTF